jgi:hypothetical protein
VHAHHDDYDKPLDVRWLCFGCHKATHPVGDEDKRVKFKGATKARLCGKDNPNSVLSEDMARQIKAALAAGLSQRLVAKAFGVHQTSISRVKLGKVYANVK